MTKTPTRKELGKIFSSASPQRPEDVVGVWVWRISLAYQRRAELKLKLFGMTHLQFVILVTCAWLGSSQDIVNQRDLVKEIGIQEAQLSVLIKVLRGRELVTQTASATDSRVRVVRITGKGLQLLSEVLPHMRHLQSQLWPSEEENTVLTGTIKTVLARWGD